MCGNVRELRRCAPGKLQYTISGIENSFFAVRRVFRKAANNTTAGCRTGYAGAASRRNGGFS